MADFSIQITVPNAAVADLVAAMQWNYGPIPDGEEMVNGIMVPKSRALTIQEIRDRLKEGVVAGLKDTYKRHQKYLADLAAQAPVPPDIV